MNEGDVALAPLPQADGQIKNRPVVLLRRLQISRCPTARLFSARRFDRHIEVVFVLRAGAV